jgi:hypothetical protein
MNIPLDFFEMFRFLKAQFVGGLWVYPEFRGSAEETRETQCRIGQPIYLVREAAMTNVAFYKSASH